MADKPKVQVLLCDGAMLVDGKWTLQGVFDRINFRAPLPGVKSTFFIYFRITDIFIKNGSSLLLELRKAGSEVESPELPPVFHGKLDFEVAESVVGSRGKRTNFEFAMRVTGARFDATGIHDIAFFVDEEFIDVWTVHVTDPTSRGEQ
ncbi:MAG: hypothetical protein M5U25_07150 [Planctomycetota bacterium]|nr:hypothetical protein [Planctomycetota bacterium]